MAVERITLYVSSATKETPDKAYQLTALWRWLVGWILVTGFIIGTLFVVLVFGGH